MSKFVDSIYKIHNNPFIFTPIVIEFFKYSKPQPKDILLSYLVLPLVLYEDSKKSLIFSKKNSSNLVTFCRNKENLIGLPERAERYKSITNSCIQYALDNKHIELNDNLEVIITEKEILKVSNLNRELKAAAKINIIFKDFDVVEIYKKLGIKKL